MRRFCVWHVSRIEPMLRHTYETHVGESSEQKNIPDAYRSEAPQGTTCHRSRSYSSARGIRPRRLELTRSRVNGCTSCYLYSIALRYAPRIDRLFTEIYRSLQILTFTKICAALIIRLSRVAVKIHFGTMLASNLLGRPRVWFCQGQA